jgi:hypothetical protein
MDSLHSVLRTLRADRARRDHLAVFREFLSHLDRVARRAPRVNGKSAKRGKRTAGVRKR